MVTANINCYNYNTVTKLASESTQSNENM